MSMSRACPMRMNGFFTANPAALAMTDLVTARGLVAICQKAGVIDRVQVFSRSTGGGTSVINARIETVFQSLPTGTLVAAGAEGSAVMPGAIGVVTITLTTPLTVAAGDIICPMIFMTSVTGSPSLAGTIATPYSLAAISAGLPGFRSNAGFVLGSSSGWTNSTANVVVPWAAVYDDGTPLPGSLVPGSASVATTLVPTSGANSYLGLKFSPDSNCNLEFVQWCGRTDGSVRWELYDSTNTLLGTSNTLASQTLNTTAANTVVARFATPIALTGGDSYRLVERSVSGVNNAQTSLQMADAAMLAAIYGDWVRTTSADGVTWTDDTTGICPGILPFITPTGSGGGGGSTQNPFRSRAFGGSRL